MNIDKYRFNKWSSLGPDVMIKKNKSTNCGNTKVPVLTGLQMALLFSSVPYDYIQRPLLVMVIKQFQNFTANKVFNQDKYRLEDTKVIY